MASSIVHCRVRYVAMYLAKIGLSSRSGKEVNRRHVSKRMMFVAFAWRSRGMLVVWGGLLWLGVSRGEGRGSRKGGRGERVRLRDQEIRPGFFVSQVVRCRRVVVSAMGVHSKFLGRITMNGFRRKLSGGRSRHRIKSRGRSGGAKSDLLGLARIVCEEHEGMTAECCGGRLVLHAEAKRLAEVEQFQLALDHEEHRGLSERKVFSLRGQQRGFIVHYLDCFGFIGQFEDFNRIQITWLFRHHHSAGQRHLLKRHGEVRSIEWNRGTVRGRIFHQLLLRCAKYHSQLQSFTNTLRYADHRIGGDRSKRITATTSFVEQTDLQFVRLGDVIGGTSQHYQGAKCTQHRKASSHLVRIGVHSGGGFQNGKGNRVEKEDTRRGLQ